MEKKTKRMVNDAGEELSNYGDKITEYLETTVPVEITRQDIRSLKTWAFHLREAYEYFNDPDAVTAGEKYSKDIDDTKFEEEYLDNISSAVEMLERIIAKYFTPKKR